MWHDACQAFSASTFSFSRGIRVKFIGEMGVDGGGPRREFYRLLVEAICSTSGLLEGCEGNKIPLHNVTALKARKFVLLGVMAGMSMLDGGPGLPVFAGPVFHYIATDKILVGSVEDVPDPVVRRHLSVVGKENLYCYVAYENLRWQYILPPLDPHHSAGMLLVILLCTKLVYEQMSL